MRCRSRPVGGASLALGIAYKIPPEIIAKRRKLRQVAKSHGVDLRTAAIRFSATPDVAVALVVGAGCGRQLREGWNSLHTKIPNEFWAELKDAGLVHREAAVPTV